MKSLLLLLTLALTSLTGCGTITSSSGSDSTGSHPPGSDQEDPDPVFDPGCKDDRCFCSLSQACVHDCTPGGDSCEVQCHPGESCDVGCAAGERCHVEGSEASSVDVDCGSSPECHITCPETGCTVRNCVGAGCQVTCGLATLPTHNGATATCP
jgi:hypothetical protein